MEARSQSPRRSLPPPQAPAPVGFHRIMSPSRAACFRFCGTPPPRGDGGGSKKAISSAAQTKRTCMCSPTTHPGSFRCSFHRNSSSSFSTKLHAGRSTMTNSLVRIDSVEGEWVRRSLTALIRPSSHQMRRRTSFRPQPSRLRYMTRA